VPSVDINECFSNDYFTARKKFLEAARAVGARLSHYQNLQFGQQYGALYTDVAKLGPDNAKKLMMTISATHGIEGFCGSGVQVGTLKQLANSILPDDIAIILVHAINPHGFASLRRNTEDGVDLNRNFVDFSKLLPQNPEFRRLVHLLVPRDRNGPDSKSGREQLMSYIAAQERRNSEEMSLAVSVNTTFPPSMGGTENLVKSYYPFDC
jgi:predicted deacylase